MGLRRLAIILPIACLLFANLHAGEPEWTAEMEASVIALEAGNLKDAAAHMNGAVIEAEAIGENSPQLAYSLSGLGKIYREQGKLDEAESLYARAIDISESTLGREHRLTIEILNNAAWLQFELGRTQLAGKQFLEILSLAEGSLGAEDWFLAIILSNLGSVTLEQGRFEEAERFMMRASSISDDLNMNDPYLRAQMSGNLGSVHSAQSRANEAMSDYNQAVQLLEAAFGSDSYTLAPQLDGLANVYMELGRWSEARAILQRALALHEHSFGLNNAEAAGYLTRLANVQSLLGQPEQAVLLLQRAVSIFEATRGADHPRIANLLAALGSSLVDVGRYDEAKRTYERVLAMREKTLSPSDSLIAETLTDIATVAQLEHKHDLALSLYQRAQSVLDSSDRKWPRSESAIKEGLAYSYFQTGRHPEAEREQRELLEILGPIHWPGHQSITRNLHFMAVICLSQGKEQEALAYARRATASLRLRAGQEDWNDLSVSAMRPSVRTVYETHITLLALAAEKTPNDAKEPTDEAFELAQLANNSATSRTVAAMAARFGSSNERLVAIVRQRQDFQASMRRMEGFQLRSFTAADQSGKSSPDPDQAAAIRNIATQISQLDDTLKTEYPEYRELINPAPISTAELQALLEPDEAVLTYVLGKYSSVLWVVRHDRILMQRLAVSAAWIEEHVKTLRLATNLVWLAASGNADYPFDAAHALYQATVAPAEPFLTGVRHVFVVPDGALESLPFHLMVTEPTKRFLPLAAYAGVGWLSRKYTFTTLPSASSLKSFRLTAGKSAGKMPFLGVGDPLHEGALRLPSSETELLAVAHSLGAAREQILLGEGATESQFKALNLHDYRVLAFSTHGLLSLETLISQGSYEPALLMTSPPEITPDDDGFLSASEIAGLSLDADLVVLSACNTAASDGTPGAEGLSGLAKAFFYAGSRGLLTSHWIVNDESTATLMAHFFQEFSRDPSAGHSEALSRAMNALMHDDQHPEYAHPVFWAPFVVVGSD